VDVVVQAIERQFFENFDLAGTVIRYLSRGTLSSRRVSKSLEVFTP
jgi:hypothetical protein